MPLESLECIFRMQLPRDSNEVGLDQVVAVGNSEENAPGQNFGKTLHFITFY